MFSVRAEERSYWRLTSLDQFDGQVWTSRADYAARPTQLPSLFQSGSSVQQLSSSSASNSSAQCGFPPRSNPGLWFQPLPTSAMSLLLQRS